MFQIFEDRKEFMRKQWIWDYFNQFETRVSV